MYYPNVPERGSIGPCPHCAVKPGNEHSMKQSGECDGIRTGVITGNRVMEIRLKNGGRKSKSQDDS